MGVSYYKGYNKSTRHELRGAMRRSQPPIVMDDVWPEIIPFQPQPT